MIDDIIESAHLKNIKEKSMEKLFLEIPTLSRKKEALAEFHNAGYKGLYNGETANDIVQGEDNAKNVHYEVGKKVRKAIADIGGMMPEEMPTPKKSLKELEREKKQEIRKVKYT